MPTDSIEDLLTALGYAEKKGINYYSFDTTASKTKLPHLQKIVSRVNKNHARKAKVHGTYVVSGLPAETSREGHHHQIPENTRPVVYVASANSEEMARDIHRSLWNSGSAPFILIKLPNEIRIYTGFDFDARSTEQGLLDKIDTGSPGLFGDLSFVVKNALERYSAEAVDDGSIWQILKSKPTSRFDYDNRVDKHLLRNLEQLETALLTALKKKKQIDTGTSLKHVHAVIGKFVYFRYLYDRHILTQKWANGFNLHLDSVLKRGATLAAFIKLSDAVEERFEGKIFPLPTGFEEVFDDGLIDLVASTFCGDSPSGLRSLFDLYDFSYIPIETLSYIYEQFLKTQGIRKNLAAVYTPEPLADYLINEVSTETKLFRGMKILDPCCGSGIFLVLAYRYLIEQELQKRKKDSLAPSELASIMKESIHGIELNLEACYVTEFSLILVLLNYLEPPDLEKYQEFRFPNLHGKNVFHGNFFEKNREFFSTSKSVPKTFDWVIGNPPWKTLKTRDPEENKVIKWIEANETSRPIGFRRIEEAFVWRSMEFLNPIGSVGFVLSANRLTNQTSTQFRKSFFHQTHVRRVTNFSNFHYLLFQADVSAITLVFKHRPQDGKTDPIWHYGPFVANQIMAQLKKGKPTRPLWSITINRNEIKEISHQDAEKGDGLTWKMALWGNQEHERALRRIKKSFPVKLGRICDEREWHLSRGVELREDLNTTETRVKSLDAALFANLDNELLVLEANRLAHSGFRFHLPESTLVALPADRRFYRARGGLTGIALIPAPHIVVNPDHSIFSDKDFIFGGSQIGIAAPKKDEAELRALSVYLSSTFVKYLLFFESTSWGIDRRRITPENVRDIPYPSFSSQQIRDLARFQKRAAAREESYGTESIQADLDEKIENALELPRALRILVHDFKNVKLSLDKRKTFDSVTAIRKPDKATLGTYARTLQHELDRFSSGGTERHRVLLIFSEDLVICQVNLLETTKKQPIQVFPASGEWASAFNSIKSSIENDARFSQWVYVQRELRFFDLNGNTYFICKSRRRMDWTRTQAISDANDLIGETLAKLELPLKHKQ